MNAPLEIPTKPVLMKTNRDFRLSSLNGYVVNFKADEPVRVPPHVYVEAVRIGAVECGEVDNLPEPEAETDGGPQGAAEAAKLAAEAKDSYIRQACLALIAEDDSAKFKAEGPPKLNALIKELPPEAPRPTAGDVQRVWELLQDDVSLADNVED